MKKFILIVALIFGLTSTVHALSWQTAPIMGYSAANVTGDLVVITGDTPTDGNGNFYYDVDGNLVLGPTIPHYSQPNDPLYGIGDPSVTDFYFDPSTYDTAGNYWYDPDMTIYAGSGVNLTPNTEYTYSGTYDFLGGPLPGAPYSVRTAYKTDFTTTASFIMLHSGIAKLWDNDAGDWSYTEFWTDNVTGETITATNFFTVHDINTMSVPEPATMILFGTSLLGLAGIVRKKIVK